MQNTITTEWGIGWRGEGDDESVTDFEECRDEADARQIASMYVDARVVCRTVTRTPWAVAE